MSMITVNIVKEQLKNWIVELISDHDMCKLGSDRPMCMGDKLTLLEDIRGLIDDVIPQKSSLKESSPGNFNRFVAIVSKLYKLTDEIEKCLSDPEFIIRVHPLLNNGVILEIKNGTTQHYGNFKRAQIFLRKNDGEFEKRIFVKVVDNGEEKKVGFLQEEIFFWREGSECDSCESFEHISVPLDVCSEE